MQFIDRYDEATLTNDEATLTNGIHIFCRTVAVFVIHIAFVIFVNGVIIARFRVPLLIATLATLTLYRVLPRASARCVRCAIILVDVLTQLWILLLAGINVVGCEPIHY